MDKQLLNPFKEDKSANQIFNLMADSKLKTMLQKEVKLEFPNEPYYESFSQFLKRSFSWRESKKPSSFWRGVYAVFSGDGRLLEDNKHNEEGQQIAMEAKK